MLPSPATIRHFDFLLVDARDKNEAQIERHEKKIAEMKVELHEQQKRTRDKLNKNISAENTFNKVLRGIDDLVRLVPTKSFH